jgi:3-oxoacyl-[acyl-carrier-protein] synthase III
MMQSNTVGARIEAIGLYFPDASLDNKKLAEELGDWAPEKILEKTGIRERRIAAEGQTALDLAEHACRNLLDKPGVSAEEIDFIILCTQAPDYILPTSACILQHALGLRTSIGAFDINLGCSGFVYGLSIASGLIASGSAQQVLLVTSDTYSKFINKKDRSVRTLFGDGASASLIVSSPNLQSTIGPFVFGTDGAGAKHLIVPAGGARNANSEETRIEQVDGSGNVRSQDNLFMDGAAIMAFTLAEVPKAFSAVLLKAGLVIDDIDYVVFHQANAFMLSALRKKMKIPEEKMPCRFENVGNTVSSTIPIVIEELMASGKFQPGQKIALVGFGVGLSWSACIISL